MFKQRSAATCLVLILFTAVCQSQKNASQPSSAATMTPIDARVALRKAMSTMLRGGSKYVCSDEKDLGTVWPLSDVFISSRELRFSDKFTRKTWTTGCLLCSGHYVQGDAVVVTQELRFGTMNPLEVKECKGQFGVMQTGTKHWLDRGISSWANAGDAQLFVDAVNALIQENRNAADPAREEADFQNFKTQAKAWRELSVKPELAADVRKEKVLAEEAIREKNMDSAIIHYETGLKADPLWPEGQFNAALLDAEFEDFTYALRHMRRYLELVPDAPDAQAAKDKMIIWEDKAQQQRSSEPSSPSSSKKPF